ncbi:MAG: S10 family peptidase, partial [Candidatus Promineifilaceae bacterium]
VSSEHSLTINGETINYTATAGTILIREEDEKEAHKAKASIFYTAYTKNGADLQNRPITFAFNGGPGSASVWLHLGLFGPKRVLMDPDGNPLPPPYRVADNEFTLLDISDIVFIDPVSTGYSRPVPGEKDKQYHEFKKDIDSIAEFIRVYTTRHNRWQSPKFLAGESYGTTRAAELSGVLQHEHHMFLNGLLLISAVLDFTTGVFNRNNDLPYILYLPTYTATAWYHNLLDDDLQQDLQATLREVEAFAETEYASALFLGKKLDAERREAIVAKLARYTGLSAEYIRQTNLRIEHIRFCKQLMRSQNRTVGRLDSRFQGIDREITGLGFEHDPSFTNIQGTYTGAFNDYMRRELGYETDLPYEIITSKVRPWSYKVFENRYVDVAETLRASMSKNAYLKVFVANGYYDMATPYFATEYTFNHLYLDPSLEKNITMTYYDAGHMMYIHLESLRKLKDDMAAFIADALTH